VTTALKGQDIAAQITRAIPDSVVCTDGSTIVVADRHLFAVAQFLKNEKDLDFDYLLNVTAVDFDSYFEVVYHLISISFNHSVVLKTRLYSREKPTVSSVVPLWRSADFQEREIYDLMGIVFEGHPNLKRLFLWEGFEGHPLRRDYL
jgi:NADH-quinone oxidoreductase subunit C